MWRNFFSVPSAVFIATNAENRETIFFLVVHVIGNTLRSNTGIADNGGLKSNFTQQKIVMSDCVLSGKKSAQDIGYCSRTNAILQLKSIKEFLRNSIQLRGG